MPIYGMLLWNIRNIQFRRCTFTPHFYSVVVSIVEPMAYKTLHMTVIKDVSALDIIVSTPRSEDTRYLPAGPMLVLRFSRKILKDYRFQNIKHN